jgi:hypothetical protein
MDNTVNMFAVISDLAFQKGQHGIVLRRHGISQVYYTVAILETSYSVPGIDRLDWYTDVAKALDACMERLEAMTDKN